MDPIEVTELDTNFKFEVAEHPGGEAVKSCFACGACTGACPASETDSAYDPRKIIRMILLGMKEKVLKSDIIWLCLMCHRCAFHCPQNVQFVKVMGVLRDMAVKQGYVDASFMNNVNDIDSFTQALRHHMVMAIADKKTEIFTANPKDLMDKVSGEL